MSLKEVFCQNKAIGILQRAFSSGRMPHAYILGGAEGVGKFKTAREWAKMLLCSDAVTDDGFADSCGVCESCRMFEAGSHPDFNHVYKELFEFTKDGKGKTTPVDLRKAVIQEFLIDKVSARPTLSGRKVFVVSEAEKLNAASQNSLLKVLEEPPEYCSIFLLCTRLEKLLPTTRSRCQPIRFGPIAEDTIVVKLKELGMQEDQGRYWARLAQGSLGQACQWAQLELAGAKIYETKRKLLERLSSYEYRDALDFAEQLLAEGKKIAAVWAELERTTSKSDINRRAQKTIVQIAVSALRDAMKSNLGQAERIINFDQKEQIRRLAGRFGLDRAADGIGECYRTLRQIDSAVNEKLIFEQLLLKLLSSDTMKFLRY
jgi:DNA polymerase-3 subunit delta'